MLVLAFPDYFPQAQRLAACLDSEIEEIYLHHFPDCESLVRLPVSLPEHVILCHSLNQPNDKLIELMFCARTARDLGAKRITLVSPYLCYMRQDTANHPGEAVSQRIVGKLLSDLFDDVITVDPHLHRISSLNEAIPLKNAIALMAAEEIGAYLQKKFKSAVILGPDSESEQWVARVAKKTGFDYFVASKVRSGDKDVEITIPEWNYQSKPVIIIDDMISTGRTIAKTSRILQAAGADKIYVAATHPLFCLDAEEHLLETGIKEIWSTDSVNHSTSVVQLDRLLSEAVKSII